MLSPRVSVALCVCMFPGDCCHLSETLSIFAKNLTFMPVCPTRSFTFTASVRRVVNFRITGTLIPPPFPGRGVLPYLGYTGTCRWIGYSLFQALGSWGRAITSEEKTREDSFFLSLSPIFPPNYREPGTG